MNELDDKFFERVDHTIEFVNKQLDSGVDLGLVSASSLFAVSRFNAWVSANGYDDGEDLEKAKSEIVDYFSEQYRKMLEDNLNDHIKNFSERVQK